MPQWADGGTRLNLAGGNHVDDVADGMVMASDEAVGMRPATQEQTSLQHQSSDPAAPPPELPGLPPLEPEPAETPPIAPPPGPGPELPGLPPTTPSPSPPSETPAPGGPAEIPPISPPGPQMPQPVA